MTKTAEHATWHASLYHASGVCSQYGPDCHVLQTIEADHAEALLMVTLAEANELRELAESWNAVKGGTYWHLKNGASYEYKTVRVARFNGTTVFFRWSAGCGTDDRRPIADFLELFRFIN